MDEDIFLTLERDFKETLDSIEAEDLWGIRIIFESDDEEPLRIARYTPVVHTMLPLVKETRGSLINAPEMVKGWVENGYIMLPMGHRWTPIATRIVKFAEVPF